MVTKINFLLMMPIHCHEIRLWELIKWSPKRKCFDLLSNSLNTFRKCIEISLENLHVDIGAKRVNGNWGFHEAEKNLEAAKQTTRQIAEICFPFKLKLKISRKYTHKSLVLVLTYFWLKAFWDCIIPRVSSVSTSRRSLRRASGTTPLKKWDQVRYLGNCPATPLLSQHFALSGKWVLMLAWGRGRWTVSQKLKLIWKVHVSNVTNVTFSNLWIRKSTNSRVINQ